jgi:YcxB-like protein
MQPPPLPNTQKISYQVPRDILIRIWWRRMMLQPRRLFFSGFILLVGVSLLFLGPGALSAGVIFLWFFILIPILQYRAIVKAIDNDPIWTDPKTLEFTSSQLALTGPNWKSEMPWTRFKGFSEDATYFFLHLSDTGIASVIPKSAFSAEQQELFRQYAQTRNSPGQRPGTGAAT